MRTAEEWAPIIRQTYGSTKEENIWHEIADSIDALAKERDELREWKRRAVECLRKCSNGTYSGNCVVCLGFNAHTTVCELAALLREATDATENSGT